MSAAGRRLGLRGPWCDMELRVQGALPAPLGALAAAFAMAPPPRPLRRYGYAYRGGRARLDRDGQALRRDRDGHAVTAVFEQDLYRQMVAAARRHRAVAVHAAAVADAAGVWLIAGRAGAGKSTCALSLLAALPATRLVADDTTFLMPGVPRLARGLARPVSLLAATPGHRALARALAGRAVDYPWRDGAGARRTGLLVLPPPVRRARGVLPLRGVALLEPAQRGYAAAITPVHPAALLQRLWPHVSGPDAATFTALCARLDGLAGVTLRPPWGVGEAAVAWRALWADLSRSGAERQ